MPDNEREWAHIATVEDFAEQADRLIREVDGQEIAVFRVDGEFYALANFCPHQAGPLCEGPVTSTTEFDPEDPAWVAEDTEHVVRCPWHGWQFDITTGESLQSDRYRTPNYHVEIEDGDIFVSL